MLTKWKEYNGSHILVLDCRGLSNAKLLQLLDETAQMLTKSPKKALVLANVEDVRLEKEFVSKFTDLGKMVFKDKVAKTAVVGVNESYKKVILMTYNIIAKRNIKPFKNEAEALDWLVA